MSAKLRVKCQKDDAGRLNWIEIWKKGRRKPLRLDFVWDAQGLTREIEFSGSRRDMPSIVDIMLMFNEGFIERIGVVKLINLIEKIELIDTITTISNVTSIDLIDLVNKISEITTIKKIESVESGISFDAYGLTSKTKVLDKLELAYDGAGNIQTVKGYEGAEQKYTLTFTWTEGALTQIVRT